MRRAMIVLTALVLWAGAPLLAGWDEGVAAFKSRNFQAAYQEFQQLVQQQPDGWRGHYMLGLSAEQLKRKDEALTHLRKAYDLNPNDMGIKMGLARSYQTAKRYSDVIKLLGTIDAGTLPAKNQAVYYQMRGQANVRTNNRGAALSDFRALAKLKPQDASIQYLIGSTALADDQLDAGISALAKAIQLDGKNKDYQKVYITALVKQGRMTRDKAAKRSAYGKAASTAAKYVQLENTYDAWMLKASAELGAADYEKAAASARSALGKKNNDWLAHFYLGQALSSVQSYSEAEPPLQQALKLAGANDKKTVWNQLGFVYEKQKRFPEAIEAYTNAGQQGAVARVENNQETAEFNDQVEKENAEIARMEAEKAKLEAELKALEGGDGL